MSQLRLKFHRPRAVSTARGGTFHMVTELGHGYVPLVTHAHFHPDHKVTQFSDTKMS